MGGKKPKTPKAPDYVALANQQAGLDRETARINAKLNRVNQTDQYGNTLTYSQDPNDPDSWSQTETMSPEQKQLWDAEVQSKTALANAGQGLLGRATAAANDPFGTSGRLPAGRDFGGVLALGISATAKEPSPPAAANDHGLSAFVAVDVGGDVGRLAVAAD